MRVAESIILDALTRGGCIKTFYRISSRQAAESATRIPEGYILESPGEREDIGVRLENGIYGHSRFCNTDFDDKLACLNLSGV
ncbi:hypothetical protein [Klebsiella variicola]|uniref:hypothetical protein n=1 Tax=Klebsiella variicola TaxID=244366 RepID=UPI001D0D901A|nr:hypothetical protein [Klebsiella variicola]